MDRKKRYGFTLYGKHVELTIASLEKSLEGVEPREVRKYSVIINRRSYPVKQVVSVALGIAVGEFSAQDAIRILKKMGYTIRVTQTEA